MNLSLVEALRLTNIDFFWTNLTNFSAVDETNGTYRQDIIDNKVSSLLIILVALDKAEYCLTHRSCVLIIVILDHVIHLKVRHDPLIYFYIKVRWLELLTYITKYFTYK